MYHCIGSCKFIPEKMKYFFLERYSKNILFAWNSISILIFDLNNFNDFVSWKNENNELVKDELLLSKIVDVFLFNGICYAACNTGKIYELFLKPPQIQEKNIDEEDLFEMAQENSYKWIKKKFGIIDKCDRLVSLMPCSNKIIFVTVYQENLLCLVYKFNPFTEISAIVLLDNAKSECAVISYIDIPLSDDLKDQYFSFLDNINVGTPIVGLKSGTALSFDISDSTNKNEAHIVFSSSYSIVDIYFLSDENVKICKTLLILVSSGSVIALSKGNSKIIYSTDFIYRSLFITEQSILITSDGFDCIITKSKFDSSSELYQRSCPLKGVRSISRLSNNPHLVIFGTQHKCIYCLDLQDVKFKKSNKFVVPDSKLLNELFTVTNELNTAYSNMLKEDSIMKAVSLASRGEFLKEYFTILLKLFPGKNNLDDKLKLRIENDCSFVTFSPEIWFLNMTLSYENNSIISFMKRLVKPFSKETPLTMEFECSPSIESILSCRMVASISKDLPLLIVPLGNIIIDSGYFLNVVKDKSKLLKSIIESSSDNNYIELPTSRNFIDMKTSYSPDEAVFYNMKLDSNVVVDTIFKIIFQDSSHLMSKNQWQHITDSNLNEVSVLIYHKYWVEISLDRVSLILKLKSNDVHACYMVKRAISSRLKENDHSEATELMVGFDDFIEAEGIKCSFELSRLNPDWSVKEFIDFKNKYRSYIVNKFSNTSIKK